MITSLTRIWRNWQLSRQVTVLLDRAITIQCPHLPFEANTVVYNKMKFLGYRRRLLTLELWGHAEYRHVVALSELSETNITAQLLVQWQGILDAWMAEHNDLKAKSLIVELRQLHYHPLRPFTEVLVQDTEDSTLMLKPWLWLQNPFTETSPCMNKVQHLWFYEHIGNSGKQAFFRIRF
jgi:hypothetical protein